MDEKGNQEFNQYTTSVSAVKDYLTINSEKITNDNKSEKIKQT